MVPHPDQAAGPPISPTTAPGAAHRRPLAAAAAAIRRFYRPFLLIQLAAVLLVTAFYLSQTVRALCSTLGAFKDSLGLPFVAVSAALAGGVLPELARWVADRGRARPGTGRRGEVAFNIAFFAFNGVVVDLLYRGESRLFGADSTVTTIAMKVAFDQFVFNPIWLPVIIALYTWRRNAFAIATTWETLAAPGFYRQRVVPLMLPAWCFWLPMVSVIYSLPTSLQFLLFVLALGAWSLIMVFIAEGKGGGEETAGRQATGERSIGQNGG